MEWARLGLYAASRCWGGAGFVLVPHRAGVVAPEMLRLVVAYDPDFVVNLRPTLGQVQRLRPGIALPALPDGLDEQTAARFRADLLEQPAPLAGDDRRAREAVAAACSPYRFEYPGGDRREDTVMLSSNGTGARLTPIDDIRDIAGGHLRHGADWAGAPGVISAARYGLMSEPVEASAAFEPSFVHMRWLLDPDDEAPSPDDTVWAGPAGSIRLNVIPSELATAFGRTMHGLTWITLGFREGQDDILLVAGDTAEDFALALGWDRLYGRGVWLPSSWWPTGSGDEPAHARAALEHLVWRASTRGSRVRIVSVSAKDALSPLSAALRTPIEVRSDSNETRLPSRTETVVEAEVDWTLNGSQHLGVDGQFDEQVSLPVSIDGDGTTTLLAPPPPPLIENADLTSAASLRWEADLQFPSATMPRGRDLPGETLLVSDSEFPLTWVRSGRGGLSYHPDRFDFVPAGTATASRLARPRLRDLGMLSWAQAQASKVGLVAALSPAGRRAEGLHRLAGSREWLADTFSGPLLPALQAFNRRGRTDTAYPGREGVVINGEGFLHFAGLRTLTDGVLDDDQLREVIDALTERRILARGLVLDCGTCERPAFTRINDLSQMNSCPHCHASSELVRARWRQPPDEPTWFYHLHPLARDLLKQHGEVPLLLSHHLRSVSRSYTDISELELLDSGNPIAECDLLAAVDGTVIAAEAKSVTRLGRSAQEVKEVINKRIRIARVLRADEIILATTESRWDHTGVRELAAAVRAREWPTGSAPSVRLIIGLGTPGLGDERLPA